MKVAVVGVTGMVGQIMLKALEERKFPVSELLPVASEKSVGQEIVFKGEKIKIMSMQDAIGKKPAIALFSAGGNVSREWAPEFAKNGTTVIDNSSAWRMEPEIPLIVPEINGYLLKEDDKIIANPNCSTIQLVMTLYPLDKKYDLRRVIVSTYQSVTGTGKDAVEQLEGEISGSNPKMKYPYPIFKNALPHCDVFEDSGYTKEEMKLVNESQKILQKPDLAVTATAVRVPVQGGHSESVNLEFAKPFEEAEIRKILRRTPGIVVQDNPDTNTYPMPIYAEGKDDVFVGRIRRDTTRPNALNMWIVADNLRKGAATNAVQIAEKLLKLKFIGQNESVNTQ
ncbi:MAG: aspartate-semialdehyde dehydrogenase [Weeksellaceae bacterium]